MYKPSFQTSSTMVPILSRAQIEEMAVEILKEFNPDQLEKPQPMDVDRFLEQYLGVDIDFKFLTHCGVFDSKPRKHGPLWLFGCNAGAIGLQPGRNC